MNMKHLSLKLRGTADAIDAVHSSLPALVELINTIIATNAITKGDVTIAPVKRTYTRKHWTQRPGAKAKIRRMVAKRKTAKTTKVIKNKLLHWTQRPENKAKVLRMNRATAKVKVAKAKAKIAKAA